MYKVISNEDIHRESWDKLIKQSATSSWFQSYNCYQFYKKLNFLDGFAIALVNNESLIALCCGYIISDGGLIKKFMSRRAIVPGGIMFDNNINNEEVELALKGIVDKLKNKAIYFELRNYFDYSAYKKTFEKIGLNYQPHLNFHLDSSNYDIAFKNLKPNKRRYVRLSLKEGAEWQITTDRNEINELYQILENLYKTKVKTPLFPVSFFQTLSEEKDSKIIVIKHNNKVIGGSVFVVSENKTIYEWFVCGEDRQIKNVYPSILATWAGIEYATNNQIPMFDFMGAGKPNIEYGVRDFKAEFGGQLVEHGRYIKVFNILLYKIGEFAVKIIRKNK